MSTSVLEAVVDLNNRQLVETSLWERLASRIVREHDVDRSYADRILDQTVSFLRLCADADGIAYAPSEKVDIGWHTFILHTRDYAAFCDHIAGRFIHHVPTDSEGGDGECLTTIARTTAALRDRGLPVDDQLWAVHAGCGGHRCTGDECRNGR